MADMFGAEIPHRDYNNDGKIKHWNMEGERNE